MRSTQCFWYQKVYNENKQRMTIIVCVKVGCTQCYNYSNVTVIKQLCDVMLSNVSVV